MKLHICFDFFACKNRINSGRLKLQFFITIMAKKRVFVLAFGRQLYLFFHQDYTIQQCYSIEIINRMKDQQLYRLIKKAVREKKNFHHKSQTENFAQRFCSNQLKRKIYNSRSQQKMGMLMKNFNKLETYFDLPQLIKQIRGMKSKQIGENRIKSTKKMEFPKETQSVQKYAQKKSYSQLKNIKSSIENRYSQLLVDSIQSNNIWKNQILKNNSIYHMSNIQQSIKNWKEKESLNQNKKMFESLQSFLKNQKEFIQNEKKSKSNQKKINQQEKKELTEFLHKVSSYLQIILEKQHKSKWKPKRNQSSLDLKPFNLLKNSKFQHLNLNNEKKPKLSIQKIQHEKCVQIQKQQGDIVKQKPQICYKRKNLRKGSNHRLYTQISVQNENFIMRSSRFRQQSTNISWKKSQEASDLIHGQSVLLKQNFTFRKRSIKSRIIKKLGKFINQIDNQTISHKKENEYYNNQIDKLEKNMKKLYFRYRKQTIADQQQIQNLKKLAQEFTVSNISKKTPSAMSPYGSQKKLESLQKTSFGRSDYSQSIF